MSASRVQLKTHTHTHTRKHTYILYIPIVEM